MLPEASALEPRLHRRQLGRVPADVDAGGDDREHARDAERRRGQEREVAGEERDRHLERRVVERAPHAADDVADGEADGDPADDVERRAAAPASHIENVPATAATIAVRSSTSAVPSLTRLSPSMMSISRRGTPSRLPDRGRGDRVGRRHDRAEHERLRPRQVGRPRARRPRRRPSSARRRPIASSEIGRRFRRSSRSPVKYAAM